MCLGARKRRVGGKRDLKEGEKGCRREGRRVAHELCAIWTNESKQRVLLGNNKGGNAR